MQKQGSTKDKDPSNCPKNKQKLLKSIEKYRKELTCGVTSYETCQNLLCGDFSIQIGNDDSREDFEKNIILQRDQFKQCLKDALNK